MWASGRENAAAVGSRRLPIVVRALAIEDGQTPPPVRGEVGHYTLRFGEVASGEHASAVVSFQALAEPLCDGSPLNSGYQRDSSAREAAMCWPTVLHGDGWSATWSAPRPVIGQVRLRGVLINDLEIGACPGVRGRVMRVQVITEIIDTTHPDRRSWRPIPAEQRLREVEAAPRWFDHGLVAPPNLPSGWHVPVPGDPYVTETGVLVDLDLDDVPPLPVRPVIVPGALAAAGSDLWIADTRLPLVVRVRGPRTDAHEVSVFRWAGRILAPGEVDGRVLHADRDGCWITGPDGIHRADTTGCVRQLDDTPTWFAVAGDGVLLVHARSERGISPATSTARLIDPGGAVSEVGLGERAAESATVVAGAAALSGGHGFVLLLRHSGALATAPDLFGVHSGEPVDQRPWLVRLSPAGALVEGPYLDVGHPALVELLGTDRPMLVDKQGVGLRRIRDDLSPGKGSSPQRYVLRAYARAGRLWVATHPPHPHDIAHDGAEACWPLTRPPDHPEDRQYWLLTELDPDTLDPILSTLVQSVPDQLAVDDTSAVWIRADGLRHIPSRDGAAAEPFDVAALLARSATLRTTGEPSSGV